MKRRFASAATSIILPLFASTASAQEAPAPARALSFEAALHLAEQHAPRMRLARSSVRAAEAYAVGAGVLMPVNPRLSADVRPPITGGQLHDMGFAVMGEVTFDVGGAPAARMREAARHVDRARASLVVDRLDARAVAWTAYVRTKAAELRLGEVRAARQLAQRVLEATKTRTDLGASGEIDQTTANLEVAQLGVAIEEAQRLLAARTMELRDALDLPPDAPILLTSDLGDPPPAPPDAVLAQRAQAARPELGELRTRVAVLDATDNRLGKEAFPRVGLYGGVDAAPVSPIFGFIGVSVELPVAQRNQGPRARVARERDLEETRLEIEGRRIGREVLAVRAAYESRRAELRVIADQAVPAAERTLSLVETGWRAGRFDVFRVTSAARDLARVRAQRLDALEGSWLERGALDRAVGGGL